MGQGFRLPLGRRGVARSRASKPSAANSSVAPPVLVCMSKQVLIAVGLAVACRGARPSATVTTERSSPQVLLSEIAQAIGSASASRVAALLPAAAVGEEVGGFTKSDPPKVVDSGLVVRQTRDTAVLFVAAHMRFGNSGDETMGGRYASGLYEAVRKSDGWHVIKRYAIDAGLRIRSQTLHVRLTPGKSLDVVDSLSVDVQTPNGFTAMLNHRARIASLRANGAAVAYRQGGGLLWVPLPRGDRQQLALAYHIDVESTPAGDNSSNFLPTTGHVRNQYVWHPFFSFSSARDEGDITLTVIAPATHFVATDLPQTDTVVNGERRVSARSSQPARALTLLYDTAWVRRTTELGGVSLTTFAAPDFVPSPEVLDGAARRAYGVLSKRFGAPVDRYVVILQSRSRGNDGWHYRSNNAVVAGRRGGAPSQGSNAPRAFFGHEIAHGWTVPQGVASNMLREGWATFAEADLLNDEFGPASSSRFWNAQGTMARALTNGGTVSIADDLANSGISYSKGAWIFRMLEQWLGSTAFDAGLRAWMHAGAGGGMTLDAMCAALERVSGKAVRAFVEPWVRGTKLPHIETRIEAARVLVTQTTPLPFTLPLEVELVFTDGRRETRALSLGSSAVELVTDRPVTRVVVDPRGVLLLDS